MQVRFGDEHAPRLRALVARDDAAALEHVDEPARPRVADAEPALEERHRGRLCVDDDVDRPVEQRVLIGVEVLVAVSELLRRRLGRLEQRLVQLLSPLGASLLDEERDLFFCHVGALLALDTPEALRASMPGTIVEVIADDHRAARDVLGRLPDAAGVQLFGERVHVRLKRSTEETQVRLTQALASAGIHLESIRPVPASLEDVFIARLGEERA